MISDVEASSRQKFMFFVAQDVDGSIRSMITALIDDLKNSRRWLLGPPKFIDVVDEPENPEVDQPIETVGGVLDIYSALPPATLPIDIDRTHFSEVTSIVEALQKLSKEHGVAFELELDGVFVGSVNEGNVDRTLRTGLLDPWRQHLEAH